MEFLGKHLINRKKTEGRKWGGFIFAEKISVQTVLISFYKCFDKSFILSALSTSSIL